jgi:hypothetical protein
MFPQISLILAEERARDLRCAAAGARRRREARQALLAARGQHKQANDIGTAHRVPDSYEDFLVQTAGSVMREPTATGRSRGQAVR